MGLGLPSTPAWPLQALEEQTDQLLPGRLQGKVSSP